MDTSNKEPPFLCTSLMGPDWGQDTVQISQNKIGFLPTIPKVSYYFSLCITQPPWIYFLAFLIPVFIYIVSLLGGMYIPTQPNTTHPEWTILKPVMFHKVFSGFHPFFLSTYSLPHRWAPSSLKSHISSLSRLCHLCLSYIYFLPIFYSLHFKFLENKM